MFLCLHERAHTHSLTGINACRSDPCLNGGTCQVSSEDPNGYTCICPPDNTGVNCNETIIPGMLYTDS